MKRAWGVLAVLTLAMAALAADDRPLGLVHFGIKGDYVAFTDSTLKDAKLDQGGFGGAELYFGLVKGLYLGVESGVAYSQGSVKVLDASVDNKLLYVPMELNAKYMVALTPWLVLDVGAGGCYSYGRLEATLEGLSEVETDWMPGGQGFADLNIILGPLYVGVDGKYQALAKFKDSDFNFNNWRLGAHLGVDI